ncbi:restriction endonuclease subunit S [Bacillus spizizenii]|uniref:restriction endonuclease subunit S n=1 Tax=Bacillus spizizenii TaxID=96241 RepID=UPI000B5323DF|nr:restriction endonuclease subunit S [Bacillus spizizenii]OWV36286.1 restriction endonuclease subunit S [Bacillus spizizenii]
MGNKKTPEVQFLGFTGGWKQKPLTELVERVIRKNNKLESTLPLTISAQYGLVDQETFFNKKVASTNLQGYYLLYKGEFAYNKSYSNGYPLGAVKRLEKYDKGVLSSLYICFRPLNSGTSDFLKHYFESTAWHKEVSMISVEGARNHGLLNISVNDFFETLHTIPTLEEQKKIGDFFKQLDDTIALHQQELTTLKQTKQGFLQKMFPKEGESVPEVRFPGFTGEWMERELKEISILITKGTTPADKSWEGTIKYIKTDSINLINGNIENTSRISKEEHEGNLKRSKLEVNDILFSIVGTLGRVGVVKEKDLPANTNQQICIIRLSEGDINFIFTALKTHSIEKFIKSDATIGAQPSISLWQMEALKVPYPQFEEQTQIGNFFKQLDDTIALHQRELDVLKETKKACLQKMFV